MLLYDTYYRRRSSFKLSQIAQPHKNPLELLELPKTSVLHYIGESLTEWGPAEDLYALRSVTNPIQMVSVFEYSPGLELQGNPITKAVNLQTDFMKYLRTHRKYRRLVDVSKMYSMPHIQLVYNYCNIDKRYRYIENKYSDYNAWYNKFATVIKTVNEAASSTNRQQFLIFDLPQTLPGASNLIRAENQARLPINLLEIFANTEERVILELWRWISSYRSFSLFNFISPEHYDKINIIFQDSGKWVGFRLDTFNRYRLSTGEEIERIEQSGQGKVNNKGVDADLLKRMFLRGLITVLKGTVDEDDTIEQDAQAVEDDEDDAEDLVLVKDAATGQVVVKSASQTKTDLDETQNKKQDDQVLEKAQAIEKALDKQAKLNQKSDDLILLDEENIEDFTAMIDEDLRVLDKINDQIQKEKTQQSNAPSTTGQAQLSERNKFLPVSYEDGLMRIAEEYAEAGLINATEYARFSRQANSYKSIKMDNGQTLEEFIQIPKEALEIKPPETLPQIATVDDKSIIGSTLLEFNRKYNTDILHRDVASMVMNLQHAGVAVTNFKMTREESVLGAHYLYEARLSPIEGEPSTIHFILPEVSRNGDFKINGVKYRFRTQQAVHLPIKKTAPSQVSLTSYYGKLFINRTERKANDYGNWITKTIRAGALEAKTIFDVEAISVFEPKIKRPRIFTILAQGFSQFKVRTELVKEGVIHFVLDNHLLIDQLTAAKYDSLIQKNQVPIGFVGKDILVVDGKDQFFVLRNNEALEVLGRIETILGLPVNKAPLEYIEAGISKKEVPVGFMLGLEMGLEQLIALLSPRLRRVSAGTQVRLEDDEYRLIFADETLVFNKNDRAATLILAGFTKFHRSLKQYRLHDFNSPDVYINVLEEHGLPGRIVTSIDSLNKLFVDPITRELLEEMGEPIHFRGLLLRAAEMLIDDHVPVVKDRIRGYERFAGAVYSELIKAVRAHQFKPSRARQPIDLSPYAVFNSISTDAAKLQVHDINPVEDVKQIDALSFTGTGGRTSLSMTKEVRLFTEAEEGLVSESTVDSGKVAVNNYAATNPKLTSLRGTYEQFDLEKDGIGNLISTAAALSPYALNDDGKRVAFIGIQHGHGIFCKDYTAPIVRTGKESTLAQQTTEMFAKAAEQDGEVLSVKPEGVLVRYADGREEGYPLGRQFGRSASLTFPFTLVCKVKKGDTFKKGDILTYNEEFFTTDTVAYNTVVWKNAVQATIGLVEVGETYEDASSISVRLAEKLTSKVSEPIPITVRFNQAVHQLVKVGQKVRADDHLCIIEDSVTAGSSIFDEDSIAALRLLKAQTPRADHDGVIERIEVYYNGEIEDMSPSLSEIANASDKQFAKERAALGLKNLSGSTLGESYRVNGTPLAIDELVIWVYITTVKPMGVGDKAVISNQLKTVVSEVTSEPLQSESGVLIDAKFGIKSVGNRIVNSVYEMGIDARLMLKATERAIAAYSSANKN